MKPVRHFLVQRQLDGFADAELDERSELAVLRHLDECVDCVTELELVVWTKTLLAQRSQLEDASFGHAVARLESWALSELIDSL